MKKMKKFVAAATVTAMTMSMSLSAFAADLSTSEAEIVKKLQDANLPEAQITQVSNYFLLDGVDVTADQAATIESKIADAQAVVRAAGGVSNLTVDQLQKIVTDAEEAGAAINVNVKFDVATGTVSAVTADGKSVVSYEADVLKTEGLKDSANSVVVSTANGSATTETAAAGTTTVASTSTNGVIKATGASSMAATYAVIAVLAMSLAGCGVVATKKRTAEEE